MDWQELNDLIVSRRFDQLKRLPYIQRIYDQRRKIIPPDGLIPNGYPYHVKKYIYNYILFGDDMKHEFPSHLKVISYVNSPSNRSIKEKYHINIFLTSDYVPDGYISNIPPNIEFVKNILVNGYKQYPPYHPTIYLYHQYLMKGGDRYFNDFLMLVDPWFRTLK